MPILTVLVNDQGDVVGTATTQIQGRGTDLPGRSGMVARPGQRAVEIEVGEEVLNLDPSALHEFIQVNYLRPEAERVTSGGQSIPENDDTGERRKRPSSPSEDRDLVITPAGPRPRDSVHAVRPNEVVRRNPDGTHTVVPTDPSVGKAGPTDPKNNRSKRKRRS
jgi:hypothetical protein